MPVKRITNINIAKRGLFTAIYGNWEDYFVDEDLKKYSLLQQLYLYLKAENYDIVLFYDTNNRFHSYEKDDLKKFLNLSSAIKEHQSVAVNKVYRASHIKSPFKSVSATTQAPRQETLVNYVDDGRYIEVKHVNPNEGFWKLRENVAEMYLHVERILAKNTKEVKSALIIRAAGPTSFDNQENYINLFSNIKAAYDSHPEYRNRVIIIYDCVDAIAMDNHFNAYRDKLFSNEYFYNIFISQRTPPIKASSEHTFYIDLPESEEIAHIVQRFRLTEKIPATFTEVPQVVEALSRRKFTTAEISKRLQHANLTDIGMASLLGKEIIRPLHIDIDYDVLTDNLNKVIGQSEVTPLIVRKINAHFNLRHRESPLSFFLVGTSGVGKTYTAEMLAASLKKSGYRYVPIDMTLHQKEEDVNRLIGSPTGYIGSETPPRLFKELEESNRLVILFDEIEKAHERVITALMQLLDKGKLSWNEKEGDFRECLLVFTSNAERDRVVALKNQQLKNHPHNPIEALLNADFQNKLKAILSQSGDGRQFRPEFCGRINSFLVYNPLKVPDLVRVAYEHIRSTAMAQYDIQLNVISPSLLGKLAFSFNESPYGLRDLKNKVKDLLAVLVGTTRIDSKLIYQIVDDTEGESQYLSPSNAPNTLEPDHLNLFYADAIKQADELSRQSKKLDPGLIVAALQSVKGQEDSFVYIADTVSTWMRRRSKPLNFFFVGPSGVGKTETAKQITAALSPFGYEIHVIPCNELADETGINRIIGSAPGYVGAETEPELFRKQRLNSKLVIVFDEIEKAQPRIMINMMGLLDEGRLNWNNDERNFNDAIIIFTSNLEREAVLAEKQKQIAQGNITEDADFQTAIKDILLAGWNQHSLNVYHKPFVYPEVFGRIQNILVFNALPPAIIQKIALECITNIAVIEQKYRLIRIDPAILEYFSNKYSYHQEGARPVVNTIKKDLNAAFDRLNIDADPDDPASVDILNNGKDGRLRFQVEIVPEPDIPKAASLPTEAGQHDEGISAVIAAQALLYDFYVIDTNIWLEDALHDAYYQSIDCIAKRCLGTDRNVVLHGTAYDEVMKFADNHRHERKNITARSAKKVITEYLKSEVFYVPGMKGRRDPHAFADPHLFEFAEMEALAGKSILFITNDTDCGNRVRANLNNLKRQKKIAVKYKVISGEEMLEMTSPLNQ